MNGTYMHALCAPLWYLHFEHTTYILYVNGGTSHVTVAHAACVRISMNVFFCLLSNLLLARLQQNLNALCSLVGVRSLVEARATRVCVLFALGN